MVRTYKKKKSDVLYTSADITNAVNDVENKNCTYREAESRYGVPISVIFHRIKGRKIPIEHIGAGRKPALPSNIEDILVRCLIARSQMGYPCDKEELINLVGDYVRSNNIKTPFKDGKPGIDWYYSFMKRHNNLSLKKPEHLQKARKCARDPFVVYDFYEKLEKLMNDKDLNSVGKGGFIFNTDETGFNNDPSRLRAIGEKGKAFARVSGGSGRDCTTVLATIAADGTFLPPLIIFKGAAVQARWTSENAYPGTLYGASANGWMEEPQFYNWFVTSFVPHVKFIRGQHDVPRQTALLLYDGHCSHISVRIIQSAIDNNIQLVRFPSHLTDKIQPLDKTVFGPIKTKWVNYGKSQMGKASGRLSKNKFSELLREVWEQGMLASNIIAGFTSTGIYPVNANKFSTDLFDPIDLQKYKESKLIQSKQTSSMETLEVDIVHSSFSPASNDFPDTSVTETITSCSTAPSLTTEQSSDISITGIVSIFTKQLKECNKINLAEDTMQPIKKTVTPRLKQMKYGEVLTTTEVLQKVKEAEDKKATKSSKSKIKKPVNANSKINKKRQNNNKKRNVAIDSDDEMEASRSDIITEDDSDENLTLMELIEKENVMPIEYETPIWNEIRAGRYLLVEFVGGSRNSVHYKYVCRVKSVDEEDGDIEVIGMRINNKIGTEFIVKDADVSSINFDMIIALLPNPPVEEYNRKLIYKFPGSIDVFEK